MTVNYNKCPFPWFGGKQHAAPLIWEALGDVAHYVEPFAGSLASLLLRPHPCNRTYYSETVNDLDGLLCNFWRSIALSPDATAEAASWPVCEADLAASHLAIVRWRENQPIARLMGDPEWHDPKIAGWWAWGQSSWIGSGWCAGTGPWTVDADGVFWKQGRKGAGTREPGVKRKLPHLGDDGRGVNRPQLREPGVADEREFHPMAMPELRRWFAFLSARLRHVRVLHGDWSRAVTTGAALTLPVRQGKSPAGIFLDPPYAGAVRDDKLYACDSSTVAASVRAWCLATGQDPRYRIVLAGFSGEGHEELVAHGWREREWFAKGFLRGGMGNVGKAGHSQKRERLWLSPHCLGGA